MKNKSKNELWFDFVCIEKNRDRIHLLCEAFGLKENDDYRENMFNGNLCLNIKKKSPRGDLWLKLILDQDTMTLQVLKRKMYGSQERYHSYRDKDGNDCIFTGIDCWCDALKMLFPYRKVI